MAFKYVYSGSRVKTLSYHLLSENQLERLLGAKSTEESFKVLQDTFLESFVGSKVEDISKPLEDCLYQAKILLSSVAPEQKMIRLLWTEFDFFNLRVIAKGKIAGEPAEDIKKHAAFPGNYSFATLLKTYEEERLGSINIFLEKAAKEAQETKERSNIDLIFDKNYLENLKMESKKIKNKFIEEFVSRIIDLFNLKTALRIKYLQKQEIAIENIFIEGGKVRRKDLENGKISEVIKQLGNGKKWKEAIENYEKTGNFAEIEKSSEEYILNFLTFRSLSVFTPATLFAYFYRLKNNLHLIKIIILGKEVGLPEVEIRRYLKKLY